MKNTSNQTDFFDRVYDVVRQIPEGRVTSYGAIAVHLGMRRSARMVGWAMNAAHSNLDIPAHRVVNRNGLLWKTSFWRARVMQQLLENEGHQIKEDQITHFKQVFWDPSNPM